MATKGALKDKTKNKIKEPRRYKVIMYNDDFTPMEFVVDILMDIFNKSQPEAIELMYRVHQGNYAVVGEYTYDIARTKVNESVNRARGEGYPFRVEMQ